MNNEAPAQILIMRHAEKPPHGTELSVRGGERAQLMSRFFSTDPEVLRFGPPVAVIAASPKQAGGSIRSLQTAAPTARVLGVPLQMNFNTGQYKDVARAALTTPEYFGRTILIFWSRTHMPALAEALGVTPRPGEWGPLLYDRFWQLEYTGTRLSSFQSRPQRLMLGDSPE